MLPSRFGIGQPSAVRKSRLDGKPSLLPKPRRPVSTDRLSSEAHRPSAPGYRSSSVEATRGTIGAGRLSREYSATKMPLNARSRSQQNDRFGQSSMTPLQSNPYSRATTTPRTPSEDQYTRNWQTCLDRALAFVTAKDQRPVSNVGWQRAQCARAAEALTERGVQAPLVRPLTIARFVEIVNALLCPMMGDAKLNTDNYVTKLPHLAKRVLYPGILSKSWLKTVNTLHAFPQALAFIVYLQDIVDHIETPVSDEWLYGGKDPISCLRRDYLRKCWIRFQDPEYQFEDLNEEYLRNLKALLGNDEEKINQLSQVIKQYEECLEDEVEAAARADEARRAERREQLVGAVRAQRAQTRADGALLQDTRALNQQNLEAVSQLELEIERATVENQELKCQLEAQTLTVEQRAKLLDDIDYANRVHDSKRDLIDKISKMVLSKEAELTLWQTKTLDSCVGFKQGLIHLSAQFPDLASLAVDEKDLMSAECAAWVSRGVECLRARQAELAEQRAEHARQRAALGRQRAALLEETRSKVSEIRSAVEREREALDIEYSKETTEAAAWGAELRELTARMDVLLEQQQEYAKVDTELDFWEKQDAGWRSKLSELQNYIRKQREETKRVLEEARLKRARRVLNMVRDLKEQVGL